MKQSTPIEPAWRLTAECPRCRNDLVVRYARHDHRPFIGCLGYPTCRYTCEYDEALQHLANNHRAFEAEIRRLWLSRRGLEEQVRRLSLTANTHPLPNEEGLSRSLTHLVSIAHPDRWAQGQPAAELAHVITQELLKLRAQLQGGSHA